MSELFSEEWADAYRNAWNADDEIIAALQEADFNSIIAFGFPEDEDEPSFVMTVQDGKVTSLDRQSQADISWDIRATKDNWLSLISNPPGLMKLGMAYTSRKMRFKRGDYATMIKDPRLAGAFVKSFALMAKVT